MNQAKLTNEYVLSEIREGWIGQYDDGRWYRAGFADIAPIYLRRVESLLTSGAARFSDRWFDAPDGRYRLLEESPA